MKLHKALLIASIGLFSALAALGVHWQSYDANTHVFLASHYVLYWPSSYDPRWYGGFSVLGYPPLLHLLVAGLSLLLGLKAAYTLLVAAAYLVSVGGAASLAGSLGLSSRWTPAIVAAAPSLFLFSFVFGQQPTLLSTGLALYSAARLSRWLKNGRLSDLASSSLLAALSLSAHHVTSLFFLPSLSLLALLYWRRPARFAAWAIASLSLSAPVAYGLLFFLLTTPPQKPIPHVTRTSILASLDASMMFFWGCYSFLPALIPYLAAETRYDKRTAPLLALAVILLVVGLGGTTPLPRLALGERLWLTLTYEKFSLWSSILLAVLAARLLGRSRELFSAYLGGGPPRRIEALVGLLAFSALLASSAVASQASRIAGTQPPKPDIGALASWLDENCGYSSYITLGMGTWSRELSYTVKRSRTLDGGYNTARRIDVLRRSGAENLDAAKYFPGGLSALKKILADWRRLGLGCVLVEDKEYEKLVSSAGFKRAGSIKSGGAEVDLWVSPGEANRLEVDVPRPPAWHEALWSSWPLALMAACLGVEAWSRKHGCQF